MAPLQYKEDALKPPVLQLCEVPALGEEATVRTVTGRVEADATLAAPLSGGPCVAFQVTGDHPLGPIDDGQCLAFTVVTDGGERMPIEIEHACLELPVTTTARTVRLEGELREFLRHRGVAALELQLELDEGILRANDPVAVTGHVETRLRPDGYRSTTGIEVFVARAEAPLLIRTLPG